MLIGFFFGAEKHVAVGRNGIAMHSDIPPTVFSLECTVPFTDQQVGSGSGSDRHAHAMAFGEMADALLLASARVVPRALLDSNYQYLLPDLESALRHLLGKDQAVHTPLSAMFTEADVDGQ